MEVDEVRVQLDGMRGAQAGLSTGPAGYIQQSCVLGLAVDTTPPTACCQLLGHARMLDHVMSYD
jgi:hypothetical protein